MKWFFQIVVGLMALAFVGVIAPVVGNGSLGVTLEYFLTDPLMMGKQGGVWPLIVSTLLVNGLSLPLVFFVGIPAAFSLALFFFKDQNPRIQGWVRLALDILAGTPSIVFGIFGNVFFCRYMGLGYSVLAGALTLTLMILPTFVRLCEDAFLSVPRSQWISAVSLGLGERTFLFKVLLPMTKGSILVALILSWARAVAETAALLFTSGYSMRTPESLMDSGRTLSVHVFDLAMNISGADQMAYQAAFVLLILSTSFGLLTRFGFFLFNQRANL